MNLRPRGTNEPDVNLTPLIDVVFLLLIFFMVSTTFNRESEIQIDLPESSEHAIESTADAIEITIDVDGEYFVNKQRLVNTQVATLKRALGDAIAGRKNPPVTLVADANTPYQAVVTAMDVAAQLGISRLSSVTQNSVQDGN
ncbi:MAG: biopolymer transporter ExbD [Gammaproteobacteria bacterium]|nr:biopolymer transporter ExbD [Gammaproteobacteria bacterium]PCH62228.1 MAG: biopolymer transporter ExbD [Gammaproteobacteria bacterium]